ncbi:aldehyde dehydrogenase family protein [Streptomyces sp. NPDC006668]|uniref:aldehyde dehydrogenase family protein n=1 Tax=Streptomyces sp. NPDC006668 TaxID=3156903 RepID=UPI0033C30118
MLADADVEAVVAGAFNGVYLNSWVSGDPGAPFGGVKAPGIGREMGRANLNAHLETKTVWTSLGN